MVDCVSIRGNHQQAAKSRRWGCYISANSIPNLWSLFAGLRTGKRKPIEERPQAMLEARELPRCSLSDFLETQLRACVAEDTRLRAQKLGRPESEVRQLSFLPVCV